jgi:hypothetical protein
VSFESKYFLFTYVEKNALAYYNTGVVPMYMYVNSKVVGLAPGLEINKKAFPVFAKVEFFGGKKIISIFYKEFFNSSESYLRIKFSLREFSQFVWV